MSVLLLCLFLVVIMLIALLKSNRVQNAIVQVVATALSDNFQTKVEVGSIDYQLFNKIQIRDVYIEDLQQDTLFYVHDVLAEFRFFRLFRKQVLISECLLDGLQANLSVDESGLMNFAFLFSDRGQKEKKKYDGLVSIKDITLKSATFRFQKAGFPAHYTNVFSAGDISVHDLNARLELAYFSTDSLNASIHHLSFREQSGFVLSDLKTQIVAGTCGTEIPVLDLSLPHSDITVGQIVLRYDSIEAAFADLWHNVQIDVPLEHAQVALSDIGALIPAFQRISGVLELSAHLRGSVSSLKMDNLVVCYNQRPLLAASMSVDGLPSLSDAYFYAEVSDLWLSKSSVQDFVADMRNEPFTLPDQLQSLGQVRYSGSLTGFLSEMVAYGMVKTDLGVIATDVLLKSADDFQRISMNGTVRSRNFRIGRLLGSNDVGNITFNVNMSAQKTPKEPLNGRVNARIKSFGYKQYDYRDIVIRGNYNYGGFDGHLGIEDENLTCRIDGLFDLTQDLPLINIDIALDSLNLNALHLTENYENSNISTVATINLIGNSLDDINGYIVLENLQFRNKGEILNVGDISVNATTSEKMNHFSVQSDYLNAIVNGRYRYSTLANTIQKFIMKYLPTLIPAEQHEALMATTSDNIFEFDVYLKRMDEITRILEFPVHFPEISMVKGRINEPRNYFNLRIGLPVIQFAGTTVEDFTLNCDNADDQVNLLAYLQKGTMQNRITGYAHAVARNDSIYSRVQWSNNDTVVNSGVINTNVSIARQPDGQLANVHLYPSQIVISDSVWQLGKSDIAVYMDSTVHIKDFNFGRTDQFVRIDGIAGNTEQDSIRIHMKDLQLGYFLSFTEMANSLSFDGRVSGDGYLYSLFRQPVFDAYASVTNATMNDVSLGTVEAEAKWERESKSVLINGLCKMEMDTIAKVVGLFAPQLDSLDLKFKANGLDLGFLNRWLGSVLQDVSGTGYGNVHIFGKPSQKKTWIEAQTWVQDGSVGLDMLGTRYTFSDSIIMTPTSISIKDMGITDMEGHTGQVNAYIGHNGQFQDLQYNLRISCDNIIGMNTTMADNDFFFGKIYATGNVSIFGGQAETNIYVNARTNAKSKFNISLGSTSVAADNSFITFVNPALPAQEKSEKNVEDTDINHVLKLVLQVEITPEASIQLLIDPKGGGDMITAKGNGNMRFEYDTQQNINLLGTYTILSGSYLFTLQDMFRREFKLDNGSSITWTGNPFNAQVNIRGIYSLTASLKDLMDETLLRSTTRTSVPVNCILNLSDNLMSPKINFDIDLPNSDEAIKQQVKNIINTDEMMNRQIIYLLVFNKFYTPEYLQSNTAAVGTGDAYSLLSSTVTNQINSWISKLTQDFSFGFNVRSSGEGEEATQEYETEFLYQPNNRLVVNGKFGYRDDDVSSNKFIGDMDIEYLLNSSGNLRAKAYTHTVDKYSLKTAQTQQGLGLVYKEDFNTVGELLRGYYDTLKKLFQKKEKKEKEDKKK